MEEEKDDNTKTIGELNYWAVFMLEGELYQAGCAFFSKPNETRKYRCCFKLNDKYQDMHEFHLDCEKVVKVIEPGSNNKYSNKKKKF